MKRRSFLGALSLAAAGALAVRKTSAEQTSNNRNDENQTHRKLTVHPDGTFKILAISDLHYTPEPDRNGIDLTEILISIEKPDLVIATGDNISGGSCHTEAGLKKAVNNVASVMENMKTPWVITLGNHDQEHFAETRIPSEQVFQYYESYPYNLNRGWESGINGAGNMCLLIWNEKSVKPVYALWLVDSGGKATDPDVKYDWIHADQINWYCRESKNLESRYGMKMPGLMYFHIPLLEFQEMILTQKVLGERHEPESPSRINSGMFAAVLERRDVMGIFCGHDHVNNYVGKFHDITLGYNGVVGFNGYPHTPPDDATNGRARGARVFAIETSGQTRFKTWMRFRDGSISWEHWSNAYESDQIK